MNTEAPIKKASRSSSTPSKSTSQKSSLSKNNGATEQMQAMIAEAAYYRAERRGFQPDPGEIVSDWLAAEAEIAKMMKAPSQSVTS